MSKLCLLLLGCLILTSSRGQFLLSGTVFDASKVNFVENVRVVSTSGMFTITDSMGRYRILVQKEDSLTYYYNGKPTIKFAVSQIQDPSQFDISLKIKVNSKYRLLQDVTVFSKTFRQDSIENRETYSSVFNYQKPGLQSSLSPDGVAGADLGQLIGLFRFRHNKRMKAFRARLEEQEKDRYINYRFNKTFVRRITGLQPPALDTFMVWYRPEFEFARDSDELSFNQYILNALYHYRKISPIQTSPALKNNQELP